MLADPRRNQRSNQPGQSGPLSAMQAGSPELGVPVVLPFVSKARTPVPAGWGTQSPLTVGPASGEVFDDLADLFLGDGHALSPETPGDAGSAGSAGGAATAPLLAGAMPRMGLALTTPVAVETLLLGQLPVLAVAWTGQYLRLRSMQLGGPVLSLRVGGDWARVELFDHRPANGERLAVLTDALEHGTVNSAATAVNLARSMIAGCVLWAGPSEELRLATLKGITDRTLLTGPDEAAVVSAYAVIKGLAGAARPDASMHGPASHSSHSSPASPASPSSPSSPSPHTGIRLAVVGCDHGTALGVAERLNLAARHFLTLEIEFAGHLTKITSGTAPILLYDGPLGESLESLVERISQGRATHIQTPAAYIAAGPAATLAANRNAVAQLATQHRPTLSLVPAPAALIAPVEITSERNRQADVRGDRARAGHGNAAALAETLSMHVPGLAAMAARCPVEPAVECAVGQSGGIHLLVRVDGPGVDPHCRAAISLQRAMRWATENQALLAPLAAEANRHAQPQANHLARPIMHLLTTWPLHAEVLRGSEIMVHAVMAVEPGAHSASVRVM